MKHESLEKLKRAFERAKQIGKGMHAMSQRTTTDKARGRMMVDSVYISILIILCHKNRSFNRG